MSRAVGKRPAFWEWSESPVVVDVCQKTGVIKGGRSSVVTDPEQRAQFFENVLEPLLVISLRYPETIYAWELINEPEWCTNPRNLAPSQIPPDDKQTVPQEIMRDFIAEGVRRINSKNASRSSSETPHG